MVSIAPLTDNSKAEPESDPEKGEMQDHNFITARFLEEVLPLIPLPTLGPQPFFLDSSSTYMGYASHHNHRHIHNTVDLEWVRSERTA
jgi:hypothetical protein